MDPLHATIEEFAADGYTHVDCYCPRCRMMRLRPISWLPRISLGLTIAQLSARLRCAEGGASSVTRALPYLYLALAIVFEVIGTSALKASETFTRLVPEPSHPDRLYGVLRIPCALPAHNPHRHCLCHVGRSRHRLDRLGWMVLVPADAGRSGTDWACPDRWRRRPCERLLTSAPALIQRRRDNFC